VDEASKFENFKEAVVYLLPGPGQQHLWWWAAILAIVIPTCIFCMWKLLMKLEQDATAARQPRATVEASLCLLHADGEFTTVEMHAPEGGRSQLVYRHAGSEAVLTVRPPTVRKEGS
jgi:hypothetical protein